MLLQRLSEYADRIDLPPAMYQNVPVRYVIPLDRTGRYLGRIIDQSNQENKRGKAMLIPDLKRTVAVAPKLLADNAEYVLGIARPPAKDESIEQRAHKEERVHQQHANFVALVNDCAQATGEPNLQAVVRFLETLDLGTLELPEDFDPSANITFEVDDVDPTNLPAVRAYWAKVASVPDETGKMECLVCGRMRSPVERLPISIKGIPGGQATGMALISANARAFESYGLEASLIAPTCEECGQRFGNALNALLSQEQTHLYAPPVVYIFWTRELAPFSVGDLLKQPSDDDVQQLLSAAWRGKPTAAQLDISPFYAATLSASGARVVVRDWIETTLAQAQEHLARYFRLQRLRDIHTGDMRWFSLFSLARATTNSKSKKEDPPAQVIQALLHVALEGGVIPAWLLYQVIRRTRAEQMVTAAHAAVIKMVLLSEQGEGDYSNFMSDLTDMTELSDENRRAYACGRLLAVLESIQVEALGDINATIVDRYYGTASSAPASVFPRLLRGAQPHLSKLRRDRKGTYNALDERLQLVLDAIDARNGFPPTFTLRGQGYFALGFYHQKAEQNRARKAYLAQRATGSPQPHDTEELQPSTSPR